MTDRKKTPDILGSLLGGQRPAPEAQPEPAKDGQDQAEQDTSMPVSQHAGIPVSQYTSKPARQHAGKPVRQQARKPAKKEEPAGDQETLKATFYLSQEAIDALEEARLRLRKMAGKDERARISKSAIVDAAILLAKEDLEAKAEKSQLAGRLVSK